MCSSVAGRKAVQATHVALLKYQAEIIIHIVAMAALAEWFC